jgi:hypothetical protein
MSRSPVPSHEKSTITGIGIWVISSFKRGKPLCRWSGLMGAGKGGNRECAVLDRGKDCNLQAVSYALS